MYLKWYVTWPGEYNCWSVETSRISRQKRNSLFWSSFSLYGEQFKMPILYICRSILFIIVRYNYVSTHLYSMLHKLTSTLEIGFYIVCGSSRGIWGKNLTLFWPFIPPFKKVSYWILLAYPPWNWKKSILL